MTSQIQGTSRPLSLAPAQVSDQDAAVDNMLEKLLNMLTLLQTKLAGYQMKTDIASSTMQKQLAKAAQTNLANATQRTEQIVREIEKMAHLNPILRALMCVASVVMMAIGGITGDPALAVLGIIMLAMTLSNGQQKLDQDLSHLPLGLQVLVQVGIDAVIAAASCGISGVADAALSETDASTSFASQALQKGFGQTAKEVGQTMVKSTLTATMIVNPWTDVVLGILDVADKKDSKEKRKMIASITGMVLSLISSLGANFAFSTGSVGTLGMRIQQKLVQTLGKEGMENTIAFLKTARSGFSVAQQEQMYEYGRCEWDRANTTQGMGQLQSNQQYVQSALGLIGDTTKQNQDARNSLYQVIAMMTGSSRLQPYIDAYNPKYLG